jgi:hypothetical protein
MSALPPLLIVITTITTKLAVGVCSSSYLLIVITTVITTLAVGVCTTVIADSDHHHHHGRLLIEIGSLERCRA